MFLDYCAKSGMPIYAWLQPNKTKNHNLSLFSILSVSLMKVKMMNQFFLSFFWSMSLAVLLTENILGFNIGKKRLLSAWSLNRKMTRNVWIYILDYLKRTLFKKSVYWPVWDFVPNIGPKRIFSKNKLLAFTKS